MIKFNHPGILLAVFFLLFARVNGRAQGVTSFSDFHIHTSFKNYYRHIPHPDSLLLNTGDTAKLRRQYGHLAWLPFIKDEKARRKGKESNMANYDQSDYATLKGLGGSVLCLSITPPEKIMLQSRTDRWLNQHLVTHISMKRAAVLADNKNSSFNEFMGEYQFVINQDSVQNGTKILLAKNNADLRRIVGSGGIGLVTTIEGGHVLFGSRALGNIDTIKSRDCSAPCRLEILQNIDSLRRLPHRVFFITVAHFGWNKMFGNAKSLDKPGLRRDLLTTASISDNFRQNMFAKFGDGIIGKLRSNELIDTSIVMNGKRIQVRLPYSRDMYRSTIGYEVMDRLLDADNDYAQPIYLDCKHMDIKARFQYYEFIDSLNRIRRQQGKKTIPIIASHIGLSGKKRPVAIATAQHPLSNSYEELIFGKTFYDVQLNDRDQFWRAYTSLLLPEDRRIYFNRSDSTSLTAFNPFEGNVNRNTLGWFYPWEINFCDEEIKFIYDNDGIVGLNMDSRIMGWNMPNYNWRYKKYLHSKFKNVLGSKKIRHVNETAIEFGEYYQAEPLLRNIFRVIEVCGRQDASAWNQLAIGSDFDGFIKPISLCATAADIPRFHQKMIAFTQLFIDIHHMDKWMYGLTAEEAMQKFFYTNGRDFIFKHFQD